MVKTLLYYYFINMFIAILALVKVLLTNVFNLQSLPRVYATYRKTRQKVFLRTKKLRFCSIDNLKRNKYYDHETRN